MLPANNSIPAPAGAGTNGQAFNELAVQNQRVANVTNLINASAAQLAQGVAVDHTYLHETYHSAVLDMNLVLHGKLSPKEQKWIHRLAHTLAFTASATGVTAMVLLSVHVPLTAPLIIAGVSTGLGTAGTYLSKGVDLYRKSKNRTVFDAHDQLQKLQKKWDAFSHEITEKLKLEDDKGSESGRRSTADHGSSASQSRTEKRGSTRLKWNEIRMLKTHLRKMDEVCALIEQFIIIKNYTKEELLDKLPTGLSALQSMGHHKASVAQDKCLSTKKIDDLIAKLNTDYDLGLQEDAIFFLKNAIICDHSLLKDESILQAKCMEACQICDRLTSFTRQSVKNSLEKVLYTLLDEISERFSLVQTAFFAAFDRATSNTAPDCKEMIRASKMSTPRLDGRPVGHPIEPQDEMAPDAEVYPNGETYSYKRTADTGTLRGNPVYGLEAVGEESATVEICRYKPSMDLGRSKFRDQSGSYKYSFPMVGEGQDRKRLNGSRTPRARPSGLRPSAARSYAIAYLPLHGPETNLNPWPSPRSTTPNLPKYGLSCTQLPPAPGAIEDEPQPRRLKKSFLGLDPLHLPSNGRPPCISPSLSLPDDQRFFPYDRSITPLSSSSVASTIDQTNPFGRPSIDFRPPEEATPSPCWAQPGAPVLADDGATVPMPPVTADGNT